MKIREHIFLFTTFQKKQPQNCRTTLFTSLFFESLQGVSSFPHQGEHFSSCVSDADQFCSKGWNRFQRKGCYSGRAKKCQGRMRNADLRNMWIMWTLLPFFRLRTPTTSQRDARQSQRNPRPIGFHFQSAPAGSLVSRVFAAAFTPYTIIHLQVREVFVKLTITKKQNHELVCGQPLQIPSGAWCLHRHKTMSQRPDSLSFNVWKLVTQRGGFGFH